jgi:UDP-GlcNAc3NAcA epimerase
MERHKEVGESLKIVTVIGARPQFVKTAVVSRAIDKWNAAGRVPHLAEKLVHTGQHYDDNMSDVFFREMHIPEPAYHLGVAGGTHGAMTGRMLEKVEQVLMEERPDVTLVYGDTNSTLAGALAAVKLHIPVGHVEAGLRSFNRRMPEEVNRIVADRVSRWLFCPTQAAVRNLRAEGHDEAWIHDVGDVMYDAALYYGAHTEPSADTRAMIERIGPAFCLCTIHRAENTENATQLREICSAIREIGRHRGVLLPLHPRTRRQLQTLGVALEDVTVVEPVGYFDMIALLRACDAVITDSGGVQKEAYFFGKPCLTLRAETEWVELVELGANVLGGVTRDSILRAWRSLEGRAFDFGARPYGNGDAGGAIVEILAKVT